MKKLLCVLMFGMVFGQSELTTRVYDVDISLQANELYDFILSDITNGDLDDSQNAILYFLLETVPGAKRVVCIFPGPPGPIFSETFDHKSIVCLSISNDSREDGFFSPFGGH